LGSKARGWVESEVDDWIRERVAARDGATVSAA
jgi:predicted DNA-binding transcriptional regulator AlpA